MRLTRRWFGWRGCCTCLLFVLTVAVATPSEAGLHRERFNQTGIAFDYPSGWLVTTLPLSNGVNPRYRFAVSTVKLRRTTEDIGPCTRGIAKQLPSNAVLAYLREAIGADRARSLPRMPPRPRSFRLPTPSDSYLCGFEAGTRWIPFKQAGRAFYLGIYVGPRATATTKRALTRLLDHMRIQRI
jgi:hypothetical protein